jgi:hypothetical protein
MEGRAAMPATDAEFRDRIHRAVWTIGDTAFHATDGRLVWVVSGRNGENKIRVEGAMSAGASLQAVEQARLMRLLRG